MKGSSM
jgi:hypothetical protein